MNITVEQLEPCRKLVRVEIPAAKVDEAFGSATTAIAREAKLPGFRPGKAPTAMVVKQYAKAIAEEAKRGLISEAYGKALKENNLKPILDPELEVAQFGRGQDLLFSAKVELAPEFELPEYAGLPARKEARTVTDEDVAKAVAVLRENRADYADVERPAAEGDIVVVNYTATSEGKPLTEFAPTARGLTQQKDFWVIIRPGSFIPGFSEQLVGLSKGDRKQVEVDFPADFVSKPLAGRHGTYEVEVVGVKDRVLPDDEKLAKAYEAESFEKLLEGVRKDLEEELRRKTDRSIRSQLVAALAGRVQFELPPTVVQSHTREIIQEIVLENQQRGIGKEQIDEKKQEIFRFADTNARERVKLSYLLGRIAEKEGIKVTNQELSSRVIAMAAEREMNPEQLAKELKESGQLGRVYEQILFAKAVDKLHEKAAIEEVPVGTLAPEGPGEG